MSLEALEQAQVIPEVVTVQDIKPATQIRRNDKRLQETPITSIAYAALVKKYYPVLSNLEDVQLFRNSKSDILSAAQIAILKIVLSPAKLNKASFYQLCQGLKILNDMERLDSGKSTANIAHVFKELSTCEVVNE